MSARDPEAEEGPRVVGRSSFLWPEDGRDGRKPPMAEDLGGAPKKPRPTIWSEAGGDSHGI
ncbi:hypothetical protein [Paracoccus beibuensis]|uniref:hypothetical protein n=1 Tax=Paracoccus beibuensis TaxID=547602 RepID=UPI00223F49FA|nr:hypothetical protein [Paracoccus beibuensis]